jgi:allophanate hydrolase subunit 2
MVGNEPPARVLECALTGPTLRFIGARRCAWRGAEVEIRVDGNLVGPDFQIAAGQTLTIGRLHGALRGWLAIFGGIDPMASRYAVAPRVLRRGEFLLESGHPCPPPVDSRHIPVHLDRPGAARDVRSPTLLHALAGPHPIAADLLQRLAETEWQVTPLLDRVGVRLRSLTPIESELLASSGSLPSCGAQFGTVQWHPNGELVILGPDHPVTGGYRQPFTLRESERGKVARLLPGDLVRWKIGQSP